MWLMIKASIENKLLKVSGVVNNTIFIKRSMCNIQVLICVVTHNGFLCLPFNIRLQKVTCIAA